MGADMAGTAIYVRQSADRADSVSLETQEQLCRLDADPADSVTVYCDRGFSGKNTERPGLRAMMRDAEAGKIGTVLVYKLDRISRNLADFTQMLQFFHSRSIAFRSHTEHFETASPMGQAMQNMLMVFAELERETISARVRDAAFARAKIGFDTGGPPPAGFQKVRGEIMGKRTHILEPDIHASDIQAGWMRYLEPDGSLAAVCAMWNANGFRTARGGTWSTGTVSRILRNPVYVQANMRVYTYLSGLGAELCIPESLPEGHGVYLYADRRLTQSRFTDLHGVYAICAPHMGIVAPEIWLACQEKLSASRRKRTAGSGSRTFLSGLIFCGNCGSAMTAVQGRSRLYLVCGGKKRGICSGAGAVWRVETAEQLVGQVLAARIRQLQATGGVRTQQTALRQKLDAAMLRRERLLQSMTESDDLAAIRAAAEAAGRLETQCAGLREQLAAASEPVSVALPEWISFTALEKKRAARLLIRCVTAEGETLHAVLN